MDEAAARLKMEATSKPEALDEIERKVRRLSSFRNISSGCWQLSVNTRDRACTFTIAAPAPAHHSCCTFSLAGGTHLSKTT